MKIKLFFNIIDIDDDANNNDIITTAMIEYNIILFQA
jgi:hypothetical protein